MSFDLTNDDAKHRADVIEGVNQLYVRCNDLERENSALQAKYDDLLYDFLGAQNEQKLSESWRNAWMKRTQELEAEQEKMIDVLHRCTLHLEKEAEAEFTGERWQANDAMILCEDIDSLFAAVPLASIPAAAYKKETSLSATSNDSNDQESTEMPPDCPNCGGLMNSVCLNDSIEIFRCTCGTETERSLSHSDNPTGDE